MSTRDHAAVIAAAIRAGCVVVRNRKHLVLKAPGGALIVTSRTPSDHRATENLRCTLRKAGVEIDE